MITQAQIDIHDLALEGFGIDFEKGLIPLFDTVYAELANLGNLVDRAAIVRIFYPVTQYIQNFGFEPVIDSNRLLNESVIPESASLGAFVSIAGLRTEALNIVSQSIEEEKQNIIQTLVFAALAGATLVPILRQLKAVVKDMIKRISFAFKTAIRNFDGAFTLIKARLAGITRFKYVGGTIPTSRQFCISHNNKIYTRKQIDNIWKNSTWGGKAPGDPFIVRGGYNCRHFFVPVEE